MAPHSLTWGVLLGLVACAATPTPYAVVPMVSPTPQVQPRPEATSPPIRYGLLPNAADYAPLTALGSDGVTVSIVPDLAPTTLDAYDAISGYGVYADWSLAPITPLIQLWINPTLAPLDDPAMQALLTDAFDAMQMLNPLGIPGGQALHQPNRTADALKTALANVGYPDGITLYGARTAFPGAENADSLLKAAGIEIVWVTVDSTWQPHLRLVQAIPNATTLPAPYRPLDLYTLPISYRVREGLQTAFTADGWLIVSR